MVLMMEERCEDGGWWVMWLWGGNEQVVGSATRTGGYQLAVNRFDQMKKDDRRARIDARFLMCLLCVLGKPNLRSM